MAVNMHSHAGEYKDYTAEPDVGNISTAMVGNGYCTKARQYFKLKPNTTNRFVFKAVVDNVYFLCLVLTTVLQAKRTRTLEKGFTTNSMQGTKFLRGIKRFLCYSSKSVFSYDLSNKNDCIQHWQSFSLLFTKVKLRG